MNIAISVWQNRISPLFDSSAHLLIAEVRDGKIIKKDVLSVEGLSLFQRVDLLQKLHIDTFVCGGITRPILENIRNRSIKVIPFVCGSVNELLNAIVKGKNIEVSFSMPGQADKED